MGRTGTEVTREASDMVLADDNFASIVAAVREGRGILDNIRKTLVYLLAGNTAELAVMSMHHIPAAQEAFEIEPMSVADSLLILGVALVPVSVVELTKLVQRRPALA